MKFRLHQNLSRAICSWYSRFVLEFVPFLLFLIGIKSVRDNDRLFELVQVSGEAREDSHRQQCLQAALQIHGDHVDRFFYFVNFQAVLRRSDQLPGSR